MGWGGGGGEGGDGGGVERAGGVGREARDGHAGRGRGAAVARGEERAAGAMQRPGRLQQPGLQHCALHVPPHGDHHLLRPGIAGPQAHGHSGRVQYRCRASSLVRRHPARARRIRYFVCPTLPPQII